MIHVDKIERWSDIPPMDFILDGAVTTKEKIERAIDALKHLPINGCITGSIWLPGFDPDLWGSTPDIDVFVYSEQDLIQALTIAEHALDMKPGTGSDRSEKQERWKLDRLRKAGLNYKLGITTYKFYSCGVVINFPFKQVKEHGRWVPITNAPAVLSSFDMSIVLQAYDIKSGVMFDLRPDNVDVKVAIPNPLRDADCMMWTVSKWVRQFDRVVKYWDRGFDTRPMAEFYLRMIDECIEAGCLFDSEESQEAFTAFADEFLDKRRIIADWLDSKKED